MFWRFKAGSTSVMIPGRATDTTGAGLAIAYNSASIAATYRREGSSSFTTISLATATAGTWTSSGLAVPTGGVTGAFELHLPNAAVAAGAKWVEVQISGVATMQPLAYFIALDTVDYQDATRFGLAALPNAAPNVSGGFFLPATYNGTCKNTSTSTRIIFNGTSGTLDTSQYLGWIAALSNGDVSRVVATSSGDGTDYVDVYPAFVHGAPNSGSVTFVLTQDIGAKVDSSLRVDLGKVAGQTASATSGVNFDNLSTMPAQVWANATRTLTTPQSQNVSGQQTSSFKIIRGNTYSATARDLTFTKMSNVDWPTNLSSGWTWTLWSERHPSNGNAGADTITGTVSVVTATGDSRQLRLAITATNTTALATGIYRFALRGTNGSSEVWDVVKGLITVED